jgi:TPP-dependent pyruvate/acetoin dehydrogenase alpha subunit
MTSPADTYLEIAVIRRFEERCVALKTDGLIEGSMHLCSGQEAIPVGACRTLDASDALSVTYRGHGWAIARGIPLADLFAELMGRDSPLCGGRGGSAFFSAAERGFLGENSIVGAGVPIAAGSALAARFDGKGSVTLCSIGEGAMNQGATHEALNMAGVMRLPLVVVIENNLYSELTPAGAMIATETLAERAPIYGMPGSRVDGNDADEVEAAVGTAVERARAGDGPSIVEAMTERLVGHYDLDPQHYRPKGEIESAMEHEPLARLRARIGDAQADELDGEAARRIEDAVQSALAIAPPPVETVYEHLYA